MPLQVMEEPGAIEFKRTFANEIFCAKCSLPQTLWSENEGKGYYKKLGVAYCCRGCAEETGCSCRSYQQKIA